jgi:hypothetical protein
MTLYCSSQIRYEQKKAESGKWLCPQYHDCELSAGHVNTEFAAQPGLTLALEILVPCILVTRLFFLLVLDIIVFFFCKFRCSSRYCVDWSVSSYLIFFLEKKFSINDEF